VLIVCSKPGAQRCLDSEADQLTPEWRIFEIRRISVKSVTRRDRVIAASSEFNAVNQTALSGYPPSFPVSGAGTHPR